MQVKRYPMGFSANRRTKDIAKLDRKEHPELSKQILDARARNMRRMPTKEEKKLLTAIRKKLTNFKPQFVVSPYIIDIFNPLISLAIEVDGLSHYTRKGRAYDAIRDAYLQKQGITILRFQNKEVRGEIHRVVAYIVEVTNRMTSSGARNFTALSQTDAGATHIVMPAFGEETGLTPAADRSII